MDKKVSFTLGFLFALIVSGVGFYLLANEVKRTSNSQFIIGYTQEVSALSSILEEENLENKEAIARSELCEAIDIIKGSFDNGEFSPNYVEAVVAMPVLDYKLYVSSLRAKHCIKDS